MKLKLTLGLAVLCALSLILWISRMDGWAGSEGDPSLTEVTQTADTVAALEPQPGEGAPPRAPGARARSSAPAVVDPKDTEPWEATVTALDPRTLAPSAGAGLVVTSRAGGRLEIAAGSTRPLQLPPGTWSIESLETGWTVTPRSLTLRAGEQGTVWVAPVRAAHLRILSGSGRPIEGARAEWWESQGQARLGARRSRDLGPKTWAESDANGLVTLDPIESGIGTIKVTANLHNPAERMLLAAAEDEITVVLTRTEQPSRLLRFVMQESGQPVPDISVRGHLGSLIVAGEGPGRVQVPGWVTPRAVLFLDAPGRAPAALRMSELDPGAKEIPWAREVALLASAADGATFTGYTVLEEAPAGPLTYLTEEGAESGPVTTLRRRLPGGASVQLECVDRRGRTASSRVDTSGGDVEVALSFGQPAALIVSVRDADGHGVADLTAQVRSAGFGRGVQVEPGSDGQLRVPLEPAVGGFEVQAHGFATTSVEALDTNPTILRGSLAITLRPTADMELHLTDPDGAPNPGISVQVEDRQTHENFRVYPELNGSLPSGHPGWSISVPRWSSAVSDAAGRVRLRNLALGSYQVDASVLDSLNPGGSSGYRPTAVIFEHRSSAPVSMSFPRPLLVEIEGVSVPARTPVPSIRVQSLKHPGRRFPVQQGSRWQGWIEADLGELVVSAPGHTSVTIASQDLVSSPHLEVELHSDHASFLRLSGEWESLPSASFTAMARRPARGGTKGFGNYAVWSAKLRVNGGRAELSFPFEGEFEFPPVMGTDHVWLFEPDTIHWSAGIEPELLVQRLERDIWEDMDH